MEKSLQKGTEDHPCAYCHDYLVLCARVEVRTVKEYWKHLCQMDDGLWYFWARWDREWIGGYNDPEEAEEWCREYHDEYQRELFEEDE